MESKTNGFHVTDMPHVRDQELRSSHIYQDFVNKSQTWKVDIDSEEFAKRLDQEDPLKEFRNLFHYPKKIYLGNVDADSLEDENEEVIYFCGHSLGLQLKSIQNGVQKVLQEWAHRGVECHFNGHMSAAFCDDPLKEKMAYLVGAQPDEVIIMNALTVNIHVLLGTFYKPTADRHKILMVAGGFHSDLYAVQSQIASRGYDPDESILFLTPRLGEHLVHLKDIKKVVEEQGNTIAIIFLEGVHYYTGQLFDMKEITVAGHQQGCIVGFDLAHAVGNVNLHLHDWNVDFAVWCTYKYLNSGPGCMGAAYVHRRYFESSDSIVPAMRGWWGLSNKKKFTFDKEFNPAKGADRFRLSNPSPYLSSMILANLEVFQEAGNERLRAKQKLLTGYLEYLLQEHLPQRTYLHPEEPHIEIVTPNDPRQRGSQISLISSVPISTFEDLLKSRGIVCDIRKPSVMRVTPAPLYNTFTEVYKFVHIVKELWDTLPFKKSYLPEK